MERDAKTRRVKVNAFRADNGIFKSNEFRLKLENNDQDITFCGVGADPKMGPQSKVGVYLGESREHAANVFYVLNPKTRHISAQYHLVYDYEFSTVKKQLKTQML